MSTLSKRELIDLSINNMFRLLYEIGRTPRNYAENKQILHALKSQGNLCALNINFSIGNESLTIYAISLNTLKKRLTDNAPNLDLMHLDKLRMHAHLAIEKLSKLPNEPKKRSRTALMKQVEELKANVSSLHAVNMVLVQALEVNRRDLMTIADTSNTGLRQRRINEAINRIIRILGLNPTPFDDVTMLSIKTHLQVVSGEK